MSCAGSCMNCEDQNQVASQRGRVKNDDTGNRFWEGYNLGTLCSRN
ncbi:hypothetical protein HanIR_Chr03g0145661 [Helianthus annuus]|nr:hypothetical protein HanIR_Chr03g0145661 [Helianthus annuus]